MNQSGQGDVSMPFYFDLRVRFSETDPHGRVHNCNYLVYFETAINEFLRDRGYDNASFRNQTGTAFHVVHTETTYFAPLHFDDQIRVQVLIARLGRSSISFSLKVTAVKLGTHTTEGKIIWVAVDERSQQAVAMPDRFIRLFSASDFEKPHDEAGDPS